MAWGRCRPPPWSWWHAPHDGSPDMADLAFVALIAAFFVLAALIVKGVERL